ncbi:MAG: cyclic nucleotide-binding domain-containing protein [Treponema sp.]|jgi:TolA-binding protein|nr:cyclic nucleotide-binding domain-containing protein [Treponema sp.]
MPKPLLYQSGSLIYFQGDAAERIFILQSGKVSLVYQDIETGADIRDSVQPGEFFGVKPALGRYPYEENAMALSDNTSVMAFTVPEFENVAMANSRIIMKMLKVFSNQLRRIHKQVSKLMAKEEQPPADSLFSVGEFYLKNKRFSQAKHVFNRYLTFYPSGKNALAAAKNYELAETSFAKYGNGKGPSVAVSSASASAGASAGASSSYYRAVNLVSQGKYQEAMMTFKTIVDGYDSDPELTAKASFEIGQCMFLMNKYDECIKYITNMLTKYPKHPGLKEAVFIMGQSNEKMGKKDQAAAFYKKVLSMSEGDDETTVKVKRALSLL